METIKIFKKSRFLYSYKFCNKPGNIEDQAQYEQTLSFYDAVFMGDPPEDIWGRGEDEYDPSRKQFQWLNLYRMVDMHHKRIQEPRFLYTSGYEDHPQPGRSLLEMDHKGK
jgi:hypothetical protein